MRAQGTLQYISNSFVEGDSISPSQRRSGTTSKKKSHQRPLMFTMIRTRSAVKTPEIKGRLNTVSTYAKIYASGIIGSK